MSQIKKMFFQMMNLAIVLGVASSLEAATYYVATNGNDTTGTGAIGSPWATITKGQSMLAPGDTLLVRGGRYYESVTLTNQGAVGNPITIKAYPGETPVLDGTEPVTGWQQCTSTDPFLTIHGVVNPNYRSIYKTTVAASKLPADMARFMLFENGIHSRISRWPDQAVGYGIDMTLFNSVAPEAYGETAFLLDTARLTQADGYWTGAWVDVFSHGANAWVIRRTIADNSACRLIFDTPLAAAITSGSTPDSYSIVNHPHMLDSAGEFAHTTTPVNGYYTFYLWPKNTVNLAAKIMIPSKGYSVYAIKKNYIVIDGLQCTGYTSHGIYTEGTTTDNITGITVKNCTVEDCGGTGVYLVSAHHSTIENCTISRVGERGAFIVTGSYGLIKNCVIRDTTSTNASFYEMQYGQMIGNTLYGCIGSHGNGISCYINCDKILVAYNYFPVSNLAFQDIKNAVVFANIFDGEDELPGMVSTWKDTHGRTQEIQMYAHNTILGTTINSALSLKGQTTSPYPQNYVINNIVDGCNSWEENQIIDMSYNLYTGYGWRQASKYNWSLQTGEIDGQNTPLSVIFKNPGLHNGADYTLKADSPAIAKGKSIASLLNTLGITAWFPDFDFTKDKAGNTWAETPSIGAYEYNTTQPANRAPVAANDTATVLQNSTVNSVFVLANDSDLDGDTLAISGITVPAHGTAAISGTQINYTPTAAYTGSDFFTYTISDGKGGTASATVTVTISQSAQPSDDIVTGLVGGWKFNENSGTTAADYSGNTNTATLVNQAQWSTGTVLLDGADDHLNCGNGTSLNLTGSLTLSAWILPESYGQSGYGRIIDKGTSSNGFSFFVNQSNNNLGYVIYGGSIVYSNTQVLQLNQWQHVAVTYDQAAQQIRFYVNGKPCGQTAYSTSPADSSASPLVIGIRNYDKLRAFDGQIDFVRVYNRALSDTEVNSLNGYGHTDATAPSTYTVTFNAGTNGIRTGGGALVQTIQHGGAATAPTITANAGWTFTGWDKTFSNVTSNLTVNAQYTASTYTVTFNAGTNGIRTGGGALVQTIQHGGAATAPTITANAGWTFTGWDKTFSNVTSNLTANALYTQLPLASNLTAHLMFDDYAGTTARDMSGSGNPATLVGDPVWGRAWAREDYLRFTTGSQAAVVSTSTIRPDRGTVALWVVPENLDIVKYFFGHIHDSANRIALYASGSQLAISLGDTSALRTGIAPLTVNTPYHIALTWDGTSYAVYVDGISKAVGTYTGLTQLAPTADIGHMGNPASRSAIPGFKGILDDARLYSRALSADEISALFNTYDISQQTALAFAVSGPAAYQASSLPAGAAFNDATQTFTWQPWYNQAGDYAVSFTAAGQPTQNITITVHDVNLADWYRNFLIYTGKLN